jgi:16S rRNA (cytidine1402-2'-O)-methyltransferase
LAALVPSGKPTDKFTFEGFLSKKTGKRKNQLAKLKAEGRTVVLYESPHRIVRFLEDVLEIYGDVDIVLARELTKKFEEMRREKVSAAIAHFTANRPRGEFIAII